MSTSLEVKMVISVTNDEWVGPKLHFTRWLPLGIDKGLILKTNTMDVRFWFDMNCLGIITETKESDIPDHVVLLVRRVNVLVSISDIEDDIAELIHRFSKEKNWAESYLSAEYGSERLERYREIAKEIYSQVIHGYNRLISFCKSEKGQYWLPEYRAETKNVNSAYIASQAEARVGLSEWVVFRSGQNVHYVESKIPDEKRALTESDWNLAEKFVNSKRRPELVGTLLALAEGLRADEHTRAALIEGVSALETAVGAFVSRSKSSEWFKQNSERFGVDQLKAHSEHLGFTCTVSYLFPMLFTEEQVSTKTLQNCQAAIKERNSVIHNGQRAVKNEKLSLYLSSIRLLCEFLLLQCSKDED